MPTSDEDREGEPGPGLLGVDNPVASRLLGTFRSFERRELIAVSLAYSAVPFVASLGVAAHAGFADAFLTTVSVYLWTAGLFGAGLTFGWWTKRYPGLWTELESVFDVPEDEYRSILRTHVGRMYDLSRILLWFPVVFVAAVIYDFTIDAVTVLIYVPQANPHFELPSVDPTVCVLPDTCIAWLWVINYSFGIASLVGLLIAIHVLIQHLRLVDEVMNLPLRDVQTAAEELTPLARFNTVLSVGWFATLTLGLVLLIAGPQDAWRDPFLSSGLLFVTLLGFVLFAVPQVSIHAGLQSAKQELVNGMDEEYDELYEDLSGTDDEADSLEELSTQLDVLEARRRNAKEIPTWAYDLPGSISLLVSSIAPLILQFAQILP
jgi:hypothetical protein